MIQINMKIASIQIGQSDLRLLLLLTFTKKIELTKKAKTVTPNAPKIKAKSPKPELVPSAKI